MEIPNNIVEQLTQTTRLPKRTVSSELISKWLLHFGWREDVAGADYAPAINAIGKMFETGRGLLLVGDAGCGKTHLAKALKGWLNPDWNSWIYCKEKGDLGKLRNEEKLLLRSVYIDDIGCEEIVKEYGNKIDAVGDFIQRYHYRGMGRFIATTNLHSPQINEQYGTRTLDRLLEMCVVLKLNGKTKRERIIF